TRAREVAILYSVHSLRTLSSSSFHHREAKVMRVPKQLLLLAVVLSIAAIQLATVTPAAAFPGDRRDESCGDRIAEIIADTPEGETPNLPADCLPDTGMSALELRAA